ncbi:sulfotransferase [Patescibacteria group bacterium]
MKSRIFNIGFGKSGSSSLDVAMRILGYKCAHWKHKDERLLDIITRNQQNSKDLLAGLEEYDYLADFDGHKYYKLIDKTYPGSKYILTLRNLDTWLVSMEKHVLRNQNNPDYKYDFLIIQKEKWAKFWKSYQRELVEYFKARPNDFLTMNIVAGDGWDKLCAFLDVQIPNKPFPHTNKTNDFEM